MSDKEFVYFSKKESEILGVKVGRLDFVEDINTNQLLKEIVNNEYDLLRLRLSASNRNILLTLNELNIPYNILNITTLYKNSIKDINFSLEYNPSLEFEEYTNSHKSILKNLIQKTFNDIPGTYYINPYLDHIIKGKEIEAISEYLFTFTTPDKKAWLVKYEDHFIGFASMLIFDEYTEGVLYGILPEYRSKNFFEDFLLFSLNYLRENNKKYVLSYVQFQNIQSNRAHLNVKCVYYKPILNIHINSLLSYSYKESIIYKFIFKKGDNILKYIHKALLNYGVKPYLIKNYQEVTVNEIIGKALIQINFINIEVGYEFLVCKIYKGNILSSFSYIKIKKLS